MHSSRYAVVVAGALLASAAVAPLPAAEDGLYLSGALGAAQQNYDPAIFNAHGSQTGYKFAAGFRPIDLLAAEVSYVDFGRAFNGINYVDTYAVGAFALAFLPIPLIDVYGKIGLAEWRTDAQSPGFGFHSTGANVAYGGGIGTSWGHLGARVEYERYEVSHSNDMGMASVGVVWTFL
jgi:OmpA-like transmembrane domain